MRKTGRIGVRVQPPSARLRAMLRGLARRRAAREVDAEPRPDCSRSVASSDVVYCTDEVVTSKVGGAAVRCVGRRCGRCDAPDPRDEEVEP